MGLSDSLTPFSLSQERQKVMHPRHYEGRTWRLLGTDQERRVRVAGSQVSWYPVMVSCLQAKVSAPGPSRPCGVALGRCPVMCWAVWSRSSCVTGGRTVLVAPMSSTVVSWRDCITHWGWQEGFRSGQLLWEGYRRGWSSRERAEIVKND